MIKIVKNVTNIENIYTYYEFVNYDSWDGFDNLLSILVNRMGYTILTRLDGIYSRHCQLNKGNFELKLMYHEDFGNCLCSQDKKDDFYYEKMENIAVLLAAMIES